MSRVGIARARDPTLVARLCVAVPLVARARRRAGEQPNGRGAERLSRAREGAREITTGLQGVGDVDQLRGDDGLHPAMLMDRHYANGEAAGANKSSSRNAARSEETTKSERADGDPENVWVVLVLV